MNADVCRIPVRATMRIIDGRAVMVDADYRDIPAVDIARFLIEKFGADAIFSSEEGDVRGDGPA